MAEEVRSIVLINAYWFSLALIGFGIVSLLLCIGGRVKALQGTQGKLASQYTHPLIALFSWFVVAFCWFGLISLIGYATSMPSQIFTYVYLFSAVLSVLYALVCIYKLGINKSSLRFKKPTPFKIIKTLVILAMVILLVLDFVAATYTRNYVHNSADSYVHLARVEAIYSNRFSISSGFFQGVNETGYHYNITYPLYIPPAQLFGQQPFQIWAYSGAFFRLIQWLAIFCLAYTCVRLFVRSNYRSLIPYLAVLFAVSVFGLRFFTPTYPNTIANLWIILIVIGLLIYDIKRLTSILALVSAAFLLTFTHSTYALMTAMCLAFYGLLRLGYGSREFFRTKEWLVLGGVIGLLMIGPFITTILSAKLNDAQFSMFSFSTMHLGPFMIKNPSALIIDFRSSLLIHALGLIGSIYLIGRAWRQSRRLSTVVVSVLAFNMVILYLPGVLSLLNTKLPLWLIDRFSAMNVFIFITPVLGCIALTELLSSILIRTREVTLNRSILAISLSALIAIITIGPFISTHRNLINDKAENEAYYSLMTGLYSQFNTKLHGDVNVVASTGDSYILGAILPVDVLAIEEGHTTPNADPNARMTCAQRIDERSQYTDLKTLNVKYILVSNYDANFSDKLNRYNKLAFLKPVENSSAHYLYEVLDDKDSYSVAPDNSCKIIAHLQGSI